MSKEQGITCELCGAEIAPPAYRRLLNEQGLRELQERHMRDCPPVSPTKQSEEKSNSCKICGGALRIAYTITFEQCRPCEIKISEVPPDFVRVCPGHFPEQDKMHDGKLDTINAATVSMKDALYVQIEDTHDMMTLSAAQALSLLTWLLQERRQLEEIAAQVENNSSKEK